MMRSRFDCWAAAATAALLLLLAPAAFAQNPTGDIRGTVTDADGGALPGVAVTATSASLQGSRTAVTNQSGVYRIALLPPGQYVVTFELEGFGAATSEVRVSAALENKVDVTLSLAAVSEEIVVTGESGQISESTTGASSYTQDEVEKLPIQRDLDDAVALAPGVHETGPSDNISISGALSYENLWTLNGVVINENLRGQELPLFIEDAIQETTVQSSGVSAEYGRFGGGVINAITKSGGNELSGSFRVNAQNDDWIARTPLSPERIDDRTEVYEATLGGYLWKDHLWFFGAGRDSELSGSYSLPVTQIPVIETQEQRRLSGKLTASVADRHTLIADYLEIDQSSTGTTFSNNIDDDGLTDRSDPQEILSFNYTGILTPDFFVEGQYSERSFSIGVGGGGRSRDLAEGSVIRTFDGRGRYHAATFCGVCEVEQRDNENALAKGSYLLSADRLGTHDLAFGYDTFTDTRFAINHQSASDFHVWDSDYVIEGNDIYPIFYPLDNEEGYTPAFLVWYAVYGLENAAPNEITTNSYYLNDRWQLDDRWSFNLGVRFDENEARNQSGAITSDDARWSPRLGATWDTKGDGDLVLHGSYGTYVASLANTVGDQTSTAGALAVIAWDYDGPAINTTCGQPGGTCLSGDEALAQFFDWFVSTGGPTEVGDPIAWRNLFLASIPGVSQVIPETIKSQANVEYTVGASKRLGQRGLLRADVVYREMEDFYANEVVPNRQVQLPTGGTTNLTHVGNFADDILEREYLGLHLQGRYRVTDRLVLAGNWTLSELTGTYEGETVGSGPVPGFTGGTNPGSFREYWDEEWAFPNGYLGSDQRHKVRLWGIYDLVDTERHNLSVGLLQSYFSGTPYSAFEGIQTPQIPNPGYSPGPSQGSIVYYFSDRGAFTFDDMTRTDLSLNYSFLWDAWGKSFEVFLQPEVLNLFDEEAVLSGDTTVFTSTNNEPGACPNSGNATLSCRPFNPFTEEPVEGVHWSKAATFGQPLSEADYQDPRTFRLSLGLRF